MSFRKFALSGFFLSAIGLLAACGTATPTPPCVDVQSGQLASVPCEVPAGVTPETPPTFAAPTAPVGSPAARLINSMGCGACHAIPGLASGALGPDLSNIGTKGSEYIHESIVNPNAVIASNCPSGPCQPDVMPNNFGERMSSEELDVLVAYLDALK